MTIFQNKMSRVTGNNAIMGLGNPIRDIIFIFEISFDRRNFERFGIREFINNGFCVEIWDISQFLHPRDSVQGSPAEDWSPNSGLIYKKMNTKDEIKENLLKTDPATLVNCIIPFSYRTLFIFSALSEKQIPYAITVTNAIPVTQGDRRGKGRTVCQKILSRILLKKGGVFLDVLDRFILKYYNLFGIRPATLCYTGGLKSIEQIEYPFDGTTEILWIHTLDYDTFLKLRFALEEQKDIQGVFLDEYIPFHPDFAMIGEQPIVSPNEYYQKVCSFFTYLEHNHNVKIVVAAHPRSDYDNLPDYFEGRPVIKGRTAELVRQSRFVITHASTSVNFAVLFRKPILFLIMDRLKQENSSCRIGDILENICSLLGKTPIDLDMPLGFVFKDEMVVDETKYDQYRNLYIKRDDSVKCESWNIIIDYLKQKKA